MRTNLKEESSNPKSAAASTVGDRVYHVDLEDLKSTDLGDLLAELGGTESPAHSSGVPSTSASPPPSRSALPPPPPKATGIDLDDAEWTLDRGETTSESGTLNVGLIDSLMDAPPQVGALVAESERLRNRLRRVSEDFERYRRRVERQREEQSRTANRALLTALLPYLDDLDRASHSAKGTSGGSSTESEALCAGIRMVLERLLSELSRFGLRGFESLGQPFDPQLHEALRAVEDPTLPDNTVVVEFKRGYVLEEQLLRPAQVAVSRAPAGHRPGPPDGPGPAKSPAPSEGDV